MPHKATSWVDFKAIKSRVSIVQILERYGALHTLSRSQNGDRLSGPCPIHEGTNKTHFRVSVPKGCWNCFGACKGGGNAIDFVVAKEGISFREAALLIQKWFPDGSQTVHASGAPEHLGPPVETPRVEEAPVAASEQMQREHLRKEDEGPNRPLGFALQHLDTAHPYLAERKFHADAIAEFGLGYCQKGSMAGRIVIPIHNAEGQLVAYAGRWPGEPPDEEMPKYKLPPGFRKAQEVFNLHRAIQEPSEAPLYVVEGFFDCIRLWQHGVRRVVALMGSSLSPIQAALIQKAVTPDARIVVMFDEDDAGRAGREKAVSSLSLHCFVRTHQFAHEGEQPDSLSGDQLRQLQTEGDT